MLMKKYLLLSVLAFVCLCFPQVANAVVYVPDCVTSQSAVFNSTDKTVTVTGVVPTKTEYNWETYEQYDLPYVSYVMIERRVHGESWPSKEYGRVNSPKMGEKFEFVDKNVVLDEKYEYRISCYVDKQAGSTVFASVYTGVTPGEVTDFTLSVVDHKATSVNMSMKAPTKSATGEDLTGTMSIEIQQYKDWSMTTIHTIDNVKPGQVCIWNHTNLTLDKKYEYRAIARIGKNGLGQGSTVSIFVGLDYPGTPENFKTVSKGETVEISWEKPLKGGRNGCYNPGATTYTLTRVYLDGQKEVVAEGIRGTKYTDKPGFEEERALKYQLEAVNKAGTCMKAAVSEPVVAGKPAALPFNESFTGGLLTHMGWTKETTQDDPYYTYDAWEFVRTGTMFYMPTDEYLKVEAQDGDEGLASCKFIGDSKDGQTEGLISSHLDVSNMDNVEVSFYYWAVIADASKSVVSVSVCKDDGEWETLFTSVAPADNQQPGWKEVKLPVALKKQVKTLRVKIAAIRHDGPIVNVFVDNVSVKEAEQTGVENVAADQVNAKVEYYNLQGIRVENPVKAGVYIKRCGKNVEKVMIR